MPSINESWNTFGKQRREIGGALVENSNAIMISGGVARSSQNTPNFGKFKRLHNRNPTNLPVNPFSYSRTERKYGLGEYKVTRLSDGLVDLRTGCFSVLFGAASGGTLLIPDSDMLDSVRSQVIMKALDKLKDQKVNLAQVFAERKMTADLIANTATRLAASVRSLKRGDIRGAVKSLGASVGRLRTARFNSQYRVNPKKAISNGWLELQYGWKPLLQDVYGSAEFLAQKQSREIRNVIRCQQSRKLRDLTVEPLGSGYNAEVLYDAETDYDESISIWFSTTGSELHTVAQAGLTNPASLAWEVLPYSFVVDWFLPVGNFLSSMDATLGLTFEKGNMTTFYKAKSRQTISSYARISGGYQTDALIRAAAQHVWCNRRKLSSFPSAVLPQFKNPFSFTHAANAIALLGQAFKTRS